MTVDPGSGAVTSAEMAQSTGSPVLDNAATSAFRRWRFKPGTVSKVRTPITFTMSGASYYRGTSHENAIAHSEKARTDRDHSAHRHHVLPPGELHDGQFEPDPHEGYPG